jgi:alcohol dehydrogenase (cytochrome c)
MRLHTKRRAGLVVAVTVVIAGAMGVYQQSGFIESFTQPSAHSTEKIWNAFSCRAGLYLKKARGEFPGVSWTDLWLMTRLSPGFYCVEGSSLAADLRYSSVASEDDSKAGAQIFHQRCTACHGGDASGGPFAPSLVRSRLAAGDSDLAIYQVLSKGIPGTAMQPVDLPLRDLLKVVAYISTLRAQTAAGTRSGTPRPSIQVSDERLQAAGSRTDEWLTYSGSYNGARYTTLDEITPANVSQLRVRWIKQFDVAEPNIEATPLVIGGTAFIITEAGHVFALDVKSGDVIWEYKRPLPPNLPQTYGHVSRGLAVHGDVLFVGGLDGHLIAINANEGSVVWQAFVADPSGGYLITGAPLVVNHSVIIGVSGGEYRIRGFLAAYDVATGKQQWRFDTIPGPGEAGHETWENDAWRTGGGATWVTGSYDPAVDLLYWGVGNPSPAFNGDARPGDNLFTDSVIALRASTGKLVWHFQFTPHDEHDRDAAQTPVLADLAIKGVARKAILWPNRNGFYYVLDRVTGEYLVGVPFVETDWATELTPTGRPILTDAAKVTVTGRRTKPGINGGVNWQNSTFDPGRGTIFIPAAESSSVFTKAAADEGTGRGNLVHIGSGWSETDPAVNEVVALDAATGRRKWRHSTPRANASDEGHLNSSYSGLLSTKSGLVFGASGDVLFALDADGGKELWRLPLGGTTKAPPISFAIDGHQVIAVAAGRTMFVLGL